MKLFSDVKITEIYLPEIAKIEFSSTILCHPSSDEHRHGAYQKKLAFEPNFL